jgi:hypothetical protein
MSRDYPETMLWCYSVVRDQSPVRLAKVRDDKVLDGCSTPTSSVSFFNSKMDNHEHLYEALDLRKREIRVLQIQPSSDQDSDVHCTLSKVEIPQNSGDILKCFHKYNALSYVWGEREPPCITASPRPGESIAFVG